MSTDRRRPAGGWGAIRARCFSRLNLFELFTSATVASESRYVHIVPIVATPNLTVRVKKAHKRWRLEPLGDLWLRSSSSFCFHVRQQHRLFRAFPLFGMKFLQEHVIGGPWQCFGEHIEIEGRFVLFLRDHFKRTVESVLVELLDQLLRFGNEVCNFHGKFDHIKFRRFGKEAQRVTPILKFGQVLAIAFF
jgi:hypothetical protein